MDKFQPASKKLLFQGESSIKIFCHGGSGCIFFTGSDANLITDPSCHQTEHGKAVKIQNKQPSLLNLGQPPSKTATLLLPWLWPTSHSDNFPHTRNFQTFPVTSEEQMWVTCSYWLASANGWQPMPPQVSGPQETIRHTDTRFFSWTTW